MKLIKYSFRESNHTEVDYYSKIAVDDFISELETQLEGCKHHSLFKIPPVSTIITNLQEIIGRMK